MKISALTALRSVVVHDDGRPVVGGDVAKWDEMEEIFYSEQSFVMEHILVEEQTSSSSCLFPGLT